MLKERWLWLLIRCRLFSKLIKKLIAIKRFALSVEYNFIDNNEGIALEL